MELPVLTHTEEKYISLFDHSGEKIRNKCKGKGVVGARWLRVDGVGRRGRRIEANF